MFIYSWRNHRGEWVREFSMSYDGAKEAVMISIKWEWEENGWYPAEWNVKGDFVDNGGIVWRA